MRGEGDGFMLPPGQANQRADAEPAKTSRISAFGAIESKIKIAFRPGGMHLRIHTAVVGFLINNEAFGACLDNWHIVLGVHRADLDRDRRKIGRERANALS